MENSQEFKVASDALFRDLKILTETATELGKTELVATVNGWKIEMKKETKIDKENN